MRQLAEAPRIPSKKQLLQICSIAEISGSQQIWRLKLFADIVCRPDTIAKANRADNV